jgi:hypothetical protein
MIDHIAGKNADLGLRVIQWRPRCQNASVAGLFREDAGRHDPAMNAGRPDSEGAAYYSGMMHDPACLTCWPARMTASSGI